MDILIDRKMSFLKIDYDPKQSLVQNLIREKK